MIGLHTYQTSLPLPKRVSVKDCLLLSERMGCRSRFLYQPALSIAVDAFVNV